MAVDDTWYRAKKDDDGQRVKTAKYGRGKRYRVRYTNDTGQPKEQMFERKVDAERFDVNTRADLTRGVYVDPAAGKVTVKAYAAGWRANLVHRGTTAELYDSAFRLHVDPVIGHMPLGAVRPSHIQAWVRDRSDVMAPATLRVVYGYIAAMFTTAVNDRAGIGTTPCRGIRLPEVEGSDFYIPTPEQVHALATALPARLRALAYLAAGCGTRQGEAWGLEVEHVNFLRREIRIVQQLVQIKGKPQLGPPKTATSRRTLEMGTVVSEALARHFEVAPPQEVEVLDATDPRKPRTRMAKLLFVNTNDQPLRRGYAWSRPWVSAVEAVEGLPDDFGYHGLRHYYATLLIHRGASVKTVQLALGHSKPSITLDMYTHEWPDAIDRTRNLVDEALGAGPAQLMAV